MSHKGAELGHMLLIKHQQEIAYLESNSTIIYDLEWSWKVKSQGHSDFEALYLVMEQS